MCCSEDLHMTSEQSVLCSSGPCLLLFFVCVHILNVVHFLNLYSFTSLANYQLGTCEMISAQFLVN
jgi:hypothetical protein